MLHFYHFHNLGSCTATFGDNIETLDGRVVIRLASAQNVRKCGVEPLLVEHALGVRFTYRGLSVM